MGQCSSQDVEEALPANEHERILFEARKARATRGSRASLSIGARDGFVEGYNGSGRQTTTTTTAGNFGQEKQKLSIEQRIHIAKILRLQKPVSGSLENNSSNSENRSFPSVASDADLAPNKNESTRQKEFAGEPNAGPNPNNLMPANHTTHPFNFTITPSPARWKAKVDLEERLKQITQEKKEKKGLQNEFNADGEDVNHTPFDHSNYKKDYQIQTKENLQRNSEMRANRVAPNNGVLRTADEKNAISKKKRFKRDPALSSVVGSEPSSFSVITNSQYIPTKENKINELRERINNFDNNSRRNNSTSVQTQTLPLQYFPPPGDDFRDLTLRERIRKGVRSLSSKRLSQSAMTHRRSDSVNSTISRKQELSPLAPLKARKKGRWRTRSQHPNTPKFFYGPYNDDGLKMRRAEELRRTLKKVQIFNEKKINELIISFELNIVTILVLSKEKINKEWKRIRSNKKGPTSKRVREAIKVSDSTNRGVLIQKDCVRLCKAFCQKAGIRPFLIHHTFHMCDVNGNGELDDEDVALVMKAMWMLKPGRKDPSLEKATLQDICVGEIDHVDPPFLTKDCLSTWSRELPVYKVTNRDVFD